MTGDELHEFMDTYRMTEDSLSTLVKVSHGEILKIVVRDLIAKRNSFNNKQINSFDIVLKYYLGEEDFVKYVLEKEEIK